METPKIEFKPGDTVYLYNSADVVIPGKVVSLVVDEKTVEYNILANSCEYQLEGCDLAYTPEELELKYLRRAKRERTRRLDILTRELRDLEAEMLVMSQREAELCKALSEPIVEYVGCPFADDGDKLVDFWKMSKDEFLKSYSYLTEEDYAATVKVFEDRIKRYNNE